MSTFKIYFFLLTIAGPGLQVSGGPAGPAA